MHIYVHMFLCVRYHISITDLLRQINNTAFTYPCAHNILNITTG